MNDLQTQFDLIRTTRQNFQRILAGFTIEELNEIPNGFNNNLVWNYAHIIVTQQILCYKLSNLEPVVNKELIDNYRKGTKPENFVTAEGFDHLKTISISAIDQLETDYNNGLFKEFKSYQTSYGVELKTIEEAIQFNIAHEAMHLGGIMALRKMIGTA
ncbi:MAG: DinB family protein [Bacteroidota bacterium]